MYVLLMALVLNSPFLKCSSCVHECEWECIHQGRCSVVCGAPCTRLLCQLVSISFSNYFIGTVIDFCPLTIHTYLSTKRCSKMLPCGHQCPSVCGEVCPSPTFCQECCNEKKKLQIVDMIEFKSYKDCDLNEDPIIVLPCQHFYTMSTCDGIFNVSEAYEFDSDGTCTGIRYMSHRDDIKPKCCPECRMVLHSVMRYGRVVSFLRLRFLEYKHILSVENSIKVYARALDQMERKKLPNIVNGLQKLMANLKEGPTQKIINACERNAQLEVPASSYRPIIRTLELLGMAYSHQVKSFNDENYTKAFNTFNELIEICDATESIRMGAVSRISQSKLILQWYTNETAQTQITLILDPIFTNDFRTKFKDLYDQAASIKSQVKEADIKIRATVINAMHTIDGYDYGGSWNSHWYECPNGHPYFIGNCGGAVETARCADCGELVGGSGHQLLRSNSQSSTVTQILKKY